MKATTATGRQGRALRLLGGLVLAGSLVLAGCSDDEPGTGDGTDVSADADGGQADPDGDGSGDDGGDAEGDGEGEGAGGNQAGETAGAEEAPAAPPTEPADIPIEPEERSASGGTDVTIEGGSAAFVLPSGNIACTVNSQTAVCQVLDKSYQVRADHLVADVLGGCTAAEADAIMVSATGAWTCASTSLLDAAVVEQGGWWVDEVDGTTARVEDLTVAVLPYGSSLTVGQVRCSSAEAGMTCRSNELGRQFTVSRSQYNFGS